jgi:hypothetical protein
LLFRDNNLSTEGLQFIFFVPDVSVDPAIISDTENQVTADLFVHGLPVFELNELFIFTGEKFDSAFLYTGRPANDNVGSNLSLDTLRKDFLKHVSESKIYGPINGSPFTPSASTYLDSCLGATLGYIDASYVPGQQLAYGSLLIKVWAVRPLGKIYPCVFVEDDNGLAWGFSISIP